jgi:polyhydroxyalkanoate synthesis regulator phasin
MLGPLKNLSLSDVKSLMAEAKKYERQLEDKIRKIIEAETQRGGLVRRSEFEELKRRLEELEKELERRI